MVPIQQNDDDADITFSTLGLPRKIHDRLFLLHTQHGPLRLQHHDDILEVQVPPLNLPVVDPPSYRKSIYPSMVDQPWHHTD